MRPMLAIVLLAAGGAAAAAAGQAWRGAGAAGILPALAAGALLAAGGAGALATLGAGRAERQGRLLLLPSIVAVAALASTQTLLAVGLAVAALGRPAPARGAALAAQVAALSAALLLSPGVGIAGAAGAAARAGSEGPPSGRAAWVPRLAAAAPAVAVALAPSALLAIPAGARAAGAGIILVAAAAGPWLARATLPGEVRRAALTGLAILPAGAFALLLSLDVLGVLPGFAGVRGAYALALLAIAGAVLAQAAGIGAVVLLSTENGAKPWVATLIASVPALLASVPGKGAALLLALPLAASLGVAISILRSVLDRRKRPRTEQPLRVQVPKS